MLTPTQRSVRFLLETRLQFSYFFTFPRRYDVPSFTPSERSINYRGSFNFASGLEFRRRTHVDQIYSACISSSREPRYVATNKQASIQIPLPIPFPRTNSRRSCSLLLPLTHASPRTGALIGPSVGIQAANGALYFSANFRGSHFLYWSLDFGRTFQASKAVS